MVELGLASSLENDLGKLKQAANLCEHVLVGSPTEKVRHATLVFICFIYFKLGEKDKAIVAAKNLLYARESRENVEVTP